MATWLLVLLAASLGAQPGVPPYQLLRAEEDWSALADPALRTEDWMRWKYVPVGDSGAWFSLGADIRERYEGYASENFGTGLPDANGYWQHRLSAHADFHSGGWRAFGQVRSVLQNWRPGIPRANDVDRLDVQQAFLERTQSLGKLRLAARVGRQEMRFGAARLTGVREGPNVRLSFDAVRLALSSGNWRVDLLAARPVETRRPLFDDKPIRGQAWWGAYATRKLPAEWGSLDGYYFGSARSQAPFAQATDRERRHTIGTRWSRPPRANHLDHDWELAAQIGQFGAGRIRAWYVASDTGYSFDGHLKPRIVCRANVASGDRDPADTRLGTFHPLYPDTRDFREQVGPGPANSIILRPFVELAVKAGRLRTSLTGAVDLFWRTSARDGVYAYGGDLRILGSASQARYIGTKPSAAWQVPFTRFTGVTILYSHMVAGQFLRDVLPGRTMRYAAVVFYVHY